MGPVEGKGLARLMPLHLQLHADVTLASDEEYADFTGWWIRRARDANVESSDLDAAEFAQVPLDVAASSRNNAPLDVERPLEEALERVRPILSGGEGGLTAGWGTVGMSQSSLRVSVNINTDITRTFFTTADLQIWFGANVDDDLVEKAEHAVIDMLSDVVTSWDVSFANVADDSSIGSLALEIATRGHRDPEELAGKQLRSYSWVTYLCPEFVARLSGVPALAETGAFWRVDRLADGVLVQATEHLADYAGDRVVAVRDALLPVLHEGELSNPRRPLTSGLRIAWENGLTGPFDYGRRQEAYDRAVRTGKWVVSSA